LGTNEDTASFCLRSQSWDTVNGLYQDMDRSIGLEAGWVRLGYI